MKKVSLKYTGAIVLLVCVLLLGACAPAGTEKPLETKGTAAPGSGTATQAATAKAEGFPAAKEKVFVQGKEVAGVTIENELYVDAAIFLKAYEVDNGEAVFPLFDVVYEQEEDVIYIISWVTEAVIAEIKPGEDEAIVYNSPGDAQDDSYYSVLIRVPAVVDNGKVYLPPVGIASLLGLDSQTDDGGNLTVN